MTDRNVPKLRFSGFTAEWEKRKLGDILERRVEHRQQSEEYPRLAFASGQGVIPLSERKTNNREQLTKDEYTKNYLVTELDDIVYNPANVKYGAIDRNKYGRGLISPIYVTFTTTEIPGFIERIVTSPKFQKRALKFEEGTVTKRQAVNPEDLVTLDVFISPFKVEQTKVSVLFDYFDNLITFHQQKCGVIKEYKKAMLQKMFPKDGKNVPELRFPGFTSAWEQRKVSEITKFHKQGFYTTEDYNENKKYYLLRGTDLTENKLILKDTPKIDATEKDYQAFKTEVGDFLIVRSGTVGTYGIVYEDIPAIFGSYLIDFRFDMEQVTNEFFGYFYQSESFKSQLRQIVQQSANTNINAENIKSTSIMLPSVDEQKKIGEFFIQLDNLITLHQRKCDQLKEYKKGLLQQMFV